MGLFVRNLNKLGLDTMEIVFLRAIVTAVVIFIYLLVFNRKMLKIRIKDFWCFLGTGIASITFFNFCYFKSIQESSLAVAAVLLYTAPAIVMILSYFFFKEKFTAQKLVSLVITFVGCVLVTGAYKGGDSVNYAGILFGLGAGLGYALYSIFSRFALDRGYNSLTITCYTFIVAAVSTAFLVDIGKIGNVATKSVPVFLFTGAFGILCTILPYFLYTLGLTNIENSKASIIASIEPVTATIIGVIAFKESLEAASVIGIIMVIGAMVLCSVRIKSKEKTSE